MARVYVNFDQLLADTILPTPPNRRRLFVEPDIFTDPVTRQFFRYLITRFPWVDIFPVDLGNDAMMNDRGLAIQGDFAVQVYPDLYFLNDTWRFYPRLLGSLPQRMIAEMHQHQQQFGQNRPRRRSRSPGKGKRNSKL